MIVTLVTVLVIVTAAFFIVRQLPAIDKRGIAAAPFVWPAGCTPAAYAYGDLIPPACMTKENLIAQPERKGLTSHSPANGRRWYRLGNDAIYTYCGGLPWNECTVYFNIKDKFVSG